MPGRNGPPPPISLPPCPLIPVPLSPFPLSPCPSLTLFRWPPFPPSPSCCSVSSESVGESVRTQTQARQNARPLIILACVLRSSKNNLRSNVFPQALNFIFPAPEKRSATNYFLRLEIISGRAFFQPGKTFFQGWKNAPPLIQMSLFHLSITAQARQIISGRGTFELAVERFSMAGKCFSRPGKTLDH